MAAIAAACQAVWLRRVLKDLCHEQEKSTTIYCENSSAIALSKNYVFHKRTKQIDTKFQYIGESVSNGDIVLQHCRTEYQFVDILTKPLAHKSFDHLRECLGMQKNLVVEIKGECWKLFPTTDINQQYLQKDWKARTSEVQSR